MYVILSDVQKVLLPRCLHNQDGMMEIALCEITYYPHWYNICADLRNNIIWINEKKIKIPDGYYNVCELNNEVFEPHSIKLDLHTPTGYLRLKNKNTAQLVLSENLAELLGFSTTDIAPGKTVLGNKHPNLAIYKELNVHLEEISTSENMFNGMPSTLLRSIPIENEKCGGGRTKTFSTLQYKKLMNGDFSELRINVLDRHGKKLNIEYLSITLHIR